VQTYLYVKSNRVAELAGGLYYYHPLKHRLILLSGEVTLAGKHHGGSNQLIFDRSAFSLFLVAEYKAIEPMYGTAARDFCLLEAGYISQLLMEEAPEYNLGLCPIGGMDVEALHAYLDLDNGREMIHSFLGGGITVEQKQSLPQPVAPQHEAEETLESDLKNYLVRKLPGYMVPNIYIQLPELPLTVNGKVDRKALPKPELHRQESEVVNPSNELERRLADLITEQFDVESLSMTDDLFDLGANSLDLVELYNSLKAKFQQEVRIADIFSYSTVQGLAELLRKAPQTVQTSRLSAEAIPENDLTPKQVDLLLSNIDNLTNAEVERQLAALEER
jgi:SagB-type dehydrogenase family enzyme